MSTLRLVHDRDDTVALLEIYNQHDHGPSPFGLSFHTNWLECGKRAALRQAEKELAVDPVELSETNASGELNYMKVGLWGHKLFEARIKRQLGEDLVWDARATAFSPTFLEAIRLYRAYHKNWGSIEERWGCKVLAAEVDLGPGDSVACFGGPLTGRADAIIEVVNPAKASLYANQTLMPGRYIFDYKFGKAHGSHDDSKFGPDNLQAQAYLWLDTLEHGEHGALGVIFERIIGHKEIRKVAQGKSSASYASFVVYPAMDSEERLRALVQLSLRAQERPMANPTACTDSFGRPCFFKSTGKCPGY